MEAYLDNSATTPVTEEVKNIMIQTMVTDYGNPSSLHRKGFEAECYVREARKKIAQVLRAQEKEILFTSGGTESNNIAIMGGIMANKRRGNHMITTEIEHPAVYNVAGFMETMGYRVTRLPVDANGQIHLEDLKAALCPETILVSIMHVNNETGAIQPVEQAGKLIKAYNSQILFHVDDIQGFGKLKLIPSKAGIDFLSVSGHKIHGPKGVGFLYHNQSAKLKPIVYGGGQQDGLRSGTENVPGIAGLGVAVSQVSDHQEEKAAAMRSLKDHMIQALSAMEGVTVHSRSGELGAPHIVSAGFEGIRAEVLLHALEEKKIYISAGSACASNHPAISRTLKAMGIPKDLLDCTLRFSFSEQTTKEQVDYTLHTVEELLPLLRKYRRG